MTHIFHRNPAAELPVAAGGEGCYLIDTDGKRYLDASGGAAVSCLGHGHPRVVEAIKRQADTLAFAHSAFLTSEPAEQLAEYLARKAPGDLDWVYFVSGGSEAVEAALKLARQYFLEIGQPQRTRFIARRQSYHGNTLGALSIGGNVWRREPYRPLLMESHHVAPCYPYREQRADETPEAYGERLASELEDMLQELGPETVIAFVAETVVGATAGALAPVPGYFKRVREVCDRYGVLLILDEVMCGMGRTGTLFACEQDGVAPDLLATAKGLGGGYVPIGAMFASDRIYQTIRAGSGAFQHGHTYMGHALACAASLAVQQTIEDDDLLSAVHARGEELQAALTERFGTHPNIGDIRGRGLFRGLELVADRDSKRPFEADTKLHARIKSEAMERGLICYPGHGTIDGQQGHHVLLAPPFILESSQVGELVDKLSGAVEAALAAVR